MCSAIFLRITVICSTRSPSADFTAEGTGAAGTAGVALPTAGDDAPVAPDGPAGAAVRCDPAGAPDSIKLKMSFLVTRPLKPVPSRLAMSTPCSSAILRTRGLDLVRRNSSALAVAPLSPAGDAGV